MWLRLLPIVLVAVGVLYWYAGRPVDPPPGVLAPEAPRQEPVDDVRPLRHRGYQLSPVARFDATARVLGTRRYRDDRAALAPYDLALGWGPMSDSAVLDQLSLLQARRVYTWRAERSPLTAREIVRHSTNVHVIPSGADVSARLSRLRDGQLVRLRGRLVDVLAADGTRWRTSRSRTDHGVGACEIVWVEALDVVDG